MKLNVISVFVLVSAAALLGMVMGGAFGFAAGTIAPDLFIRFIPWQTTEPVGTATVLSATVGVLLGGGLGVFGVLVQTVISMVARRNSNA